MPQQHKDCPTMFPTDMLDWMSAYFITATLSAVWRLKCDSKLNGTIQTQPAPTSSVPLPDWNAIKTPGWLVNPKLSSSTSQTNKYISFTCYFDVRGYVWATTCVWRPGDTFMESVPSFHLYVVSGDSIKVVRPVWQPLNHHTNLHTIRSD